MKTISEIKTEKQEKYNTLMRNCLVFWAFSNEQFEQNKTPLAEGEKYVRIYGGGLMPQGQVNNFNEGIQTIEKWYKAELKSNKARKANILYELCNHEAFYTGDVSDTLETLGSDYTRKEVLEVYHKEHKRQMIAEFKEKENLQTV
jgi:hypothetical protein